MTPLRILIDPPLKFVLSGWAGRRRGRGREGNDAWLVRAFRGVGGLLGSALRQPAFSWAGVGTMPALGSSVASAHGAAGPIQLRPGGHRYAVLLCTVLATFFWPVACGESRRVEPRGGSTEDRTVLDVELECTLQGGVELCRLGGRYWPSCHSAARKFGVAELPLPVPWGAGAAQPIPYSFTAGKCQLRRSQTAMLPGKLTPVLSKHCR